MLEEDPEEITIDPWKLWTVDLMREVYVGEVLLQFDGNSRFAYVRGLCKVRHARVRGVRVSVRVSLTDRYIVVEVSWRSLRSLLKQVFCSSSRLYLTDSIECLASFCGIFQLNSNGKGMRTLQCISEAYYNGARNVCKFGEK